VKRIEIIEIEGVFYHNTKPNIRTSKEVLEKLADEWKYPLFKAKNQYFLTDAKYVYYVLTPHYIFYCLSSE